MPLNLPDSLQNMIERKGSESDSTPTFFYKGKNGVFDVCMKLILDIIADYFTDDVKQTLPKAHAFVSKLHDGKAK